MDIVPLLTRIAVQVDEDTSPYPGAVLSGFIDCSRGNKRLCGTEFRKRYDADEYYANRFNCKEDTQYAVRVTIEYRDATSDKLLARYSQPFITRTRSSLTPQTGGTIYYLDTESGDNSNNGLTPATAVQWFNGFTGGKTLAPGDTIRIVEGNLNGGSSAQTRLRGINGSATNWIKIEPCPPELLPMGKDPTIRRAVALDGAWTDNGGGDFSMPLVDTTHFAASSGTYLGVIWDSTVGKHLYPFKDKTAFDAGTAGDGTGYCVVLSGSGPYTAVLHVRLASDANPGTGRLTASFGGGLSIQSDKYIVIDGVGFEFCGSVGSNGTNSGAGLQIDDFTAGAACENIVVRNCAFDHNTIDLAIVDQVAVAGINYILIEDNNFEFDGAWAHFYSGFSPSVHYNQTTSWSHIKDSQWERHFISLNGHVGVCVRNNTFRGKDGTISSTGGDTNMKHYHQYGNTFSECWDDAAGEWEGASGINAAVHNETVTDATALISFAPYDAGPFWFFSSSIDGFLHYPLKMGSQGDTDESHGPKIISNISAKSKGWGSDDYRDGRQLSNGGYSNAEITNFVLDGEQTGNGAQSAYWIEDVPDDPYEVVAPNYWRNSLFHVRANATPVQPKVYHRNAAGTLTEFDSFDATQDGSGQEVDPTKIVFDGVVGTWSEDSDPNPFPTTIADGLNPAITMKSRYVRGITDLAGDSSAVEVQLVELPLGSFPLRAAV